MSPKKRTLAEIKAMLANIDSESDMLFQEFLLDQRSGVQKLLVSWRKNQEKAARLVAHFQEMQSFENESRKKGYHLIAGIDEVGRGPLAGPVVAAAVILPEGFKEYEVNDSKKLSEAKREALFLKIKDEAIAIGIGICSHEIIDEVNIYEATKLAMVAAVKELQPQPDCLLIDAMTLPLEFPQEKIIKGDARSISIAAASIVAKVTRDRMMKEFADKYPSYDFENNAGYGTKKHLEGLEKNGACSIHRKTFAPIKDMI